MSKKNALPSAGGSYSRNPKDGGLKKLAGTEEVTPDRAAPAPKPQPKEEED